jgi:predicted dehydrogenase
MNKVGLGFIGCGLVVRDLHWPALTRMGDKFKIVDVASRNEEKAKAFAHMSGSETYHTDYHDVLKNPDVEAVVVSYPFEMNHRITKEALESGKHVLVEKPMAANIIEAKEMVEWEKTYSLVTMIAENFRYRETFTQAKKYIDGGAIGRPCTMLYSIILNFGRDLKWLVDSKWRLNCIGGIMLDKEVHFLAGMRLLLGEIKSAVGFAGRARDNIGPLDYVSFHGVFENGAIATMYDVASVEGCNRNDIIITGTEGTMIIEPDMNTVAINHVSGNKEKYLFDNDNTLCYIREFDDFYNAVRKGIKTKSSFWEGYKDLQMGLTALNSNDKWKDLSLDN